MRDDYDEGMTERYEKEHMNHDRAHIDGHDRTKNCMDSFFSYLGFVTTYIILRY